MRYLYKRDAMPYLDYLKCLNSAQLLDLLEDDDTIQDTMKGDSKLRGLQRRKSVLKASSCWLAKQNLAYQPYLNKTKLLLAEKYQILDQVVSSIQSKQRELEMLQQRLNLTVIQRLFKEKINHSINQSENLWQTFTEGKSLLTDFVESLQNSQKLYHRRLIQAEKIQDLIIQAQLYEREVAFPRVGHLLNVLHSPTTTINVMSSISPVILLPGFQNPHLLPTSFLPPLKHHGCVDSSSPLRSNYESCHKQCLCKCTGSHRWPQRHSPLQPLEKTRHNIYQAKNPK